MLEFTINGLDQVRVWHQDPPQLAYRSLELVSRSYPQLPSSQSDPRLLVFEIRIPHGGKSSHGLLGANFIPENIDRLTVRVPVTEDGDEPLKWMFSSKHSQAYAGLLADYTPAVFEGVERALNSYSLGAGSLTFDYAAHSIIDSSYNVFKNMSSTIVELLSQPSLDETAMAEVIERWCFYKRAEKQATT